MAEKLNAGGMFPQLTLQVGAGDTIASIELPQLKDAGYSIVLFYRGHW